MTQPEKPASLFSTTSHIGSVRRQKRVYPRLALGNAWLAEIGFLPGDDVAVTCPELGVLIISRIPGGLTPAQRLRRQRKRQGEGGKLATLNRRKLRDL